MIALATAGSIVVPCASGGSIFDDDWTPPAPRRPIVPPQEIPATGPVVPVAPAAQLPVPAPSTIDSTAARRRPVPDKLVQARSRKLFKEVFAKDLIDRSATGRLVLAAKLLAEAGKSADVPSDEFVLLVGASDAARDADDLSLCLQALDQLATAYEVDGVQVKCETALKMPMHFDGPIEVAENCRAGLELVNQLVAAGDYSEAARLLAKLRQAASGDARFSAILQRKSRDVNALQAAEERVIQPLAKLKATPGDPVANREVGRFLSFVRGDWDRGLPLLIKGDNAAWKGLASQDLTRPTDPRKQIDLGDAWWAAAEGQDGITQGAMRRRAADWYAMAIKSGSIAGLARERLEQRIAATVPAEDDLTTASWMFVSARVSNLNLDVVSASKDDGAAVDQAKPNPKQVWKLVKAEKPGFYYIKSNVSGLDLDVRGASKVENADVCQAVPNLAQVWKVTPAGGGFYYITSNVNGFNLAVLDKSASSGAKIVTAPADPAQVWKFTAAVSN